MSKNIIIVLLVALCIWQGSMKWSERSKRIKLEAEIDRHICKVVDRGTLYTQLWPTEQFSMSLQEMFDWKHEVPDSLLAVPPKDPIKMTNAERLIFLDTVTINDTISF